jgi:dTDP-4-amino-4,6-dideoxy-D-galactose acyltransferase
MSQKTGETLNQSFVLLPWDSQHFGFAVARILPLELSESELRGVLSLAKANGVHLLYWGTAADSDVSHALLRTYSGLLVDEKATFQKTFFPKPHIYGEQPLSETCEIVEYTQSESTESLLSLAVQAGFHSRFKIDPHIHEKDFESLYHIWMKRSTAHELADVVFIAVDRSFHDQILGVITASVEQGIGSIGLIAVSPDCQGRGVGSSLMHTVHNWMQTHGINATKVTTQYRNEAARQLYTRLGYRLKALQHIYHFWVQD